MAANAKYQVPVCPTDCNNISNLPDTSFESCVEAMGIYESEIDTLFITIPDASDDNPTPLATFDATGIQDWFDTNVGASPKTVRQIIGIGDMDSEAGDTATFSKGRVKNLGNRQYTLNFTVDDLNDDNREFLRQLQCGATVVLHFSTRGGNFFGGVEGILGEISDVRLPLERGDNNFEYGVLTFTFTAKADPPRVANPLAA